MSETAITQPSPASIDSSLDSPGLAHSVDGHSQSGLSETASDNGELMTATYDMSCWTQTNNSALAKVQSAPAKTSDTPSKSSDKPRPHICATCQRSFNRLEHLKRHERSHTKEKPFECPECTRCFARRDLLLRHQQKLHLTTAPSVKPSKARRESVTSAASTKIRKNSSTSSTGGTPGRPRANTISHVDGRTIDILQNMHRQMSGQGDGGADYSQMVNASRAQGQFNAQGMTHNGQSNGLPRLATHGLDNDGNAGGSLRTAPAVPGMNGNFNFGMPQLAGSTINPAQLHMGDGRDDGAFGPMDSPMMDDDDGFDFMRYDPQQPKFSNGMAHGLQPSPSMMNHAGDLNMQGNEGFGNVHDQSMMWQRHASMSGPLPEHNGMNGIHNMPMHMSPMSPHRFQAPQNGENYYQSPPPMNSLSPRSAINGFSGQLPHQMMYTSEGTSVSSMSINGGSNGTGRHSSLTSVSTDTITEMTRSALLMSLSQPQQLAHGSRKFSAPAVSSPLREAARSGLPTPSLPSTQDLQRFVGAYIQYFHPHFPFLHIPTLTFDTPAYTSHLHPTTSPSPGSEAQSQPSVVGGGGCLVLAMAAIGALYEQDQAASKEIFDAAKKLIQLYLDERRKADAKKNANTQPTQNTPLWLVQAMLLNVIYGHNCSDKVVGDIAENACASLITLARSAGLLSPLSEGSIGAQLYHDGHRLSPIRESPNHDFNNQYGMGNAAPDESQHWNRWVIVEERKRALYAIFHMSSLLVASYNHPPFLMNSAVELDLPCEEALWKAESANAWIALGGQQAADQSSIPFAGALSMLLNASRSQGDYQRLSHPHLFGSSIPVQDLPPSPLKPSTFGCLALIDALHNYIWETRQRHSGRQWTTQETESMHGHIEPALRAWQAAWAANPTHSLERPNPHGMGPLSADCIPLLDLAYVRLFVSFGTAKEAFWARDFDAMSEELARGSDFVQHADHSEGSTEANSANQSRDSPVTNGAMNGETRQSHQGNSDEVQSSKRERQLRKAAFYAADSLSMADKLGVTFADFTSRELPLQAGLCTFDCAQILAEWVSTVQERVGRYIGVLGRDPVEYQQVPAMILLENEDVKLLEKIADILCKAETKMTAAIRNMQGSEAMSAMHKLPSCSNKGYGSKILTVTAHMFERNEIWPG